ncbi:MAG: EpsI family protein, partial [Desulfobacterales bacterium GWB2_56_26]
MLGPVPGYQITGTLALDPTTVSYLELDDYTQGGYKKDGSAINLYIGYYFTSDKVSAAHSPLVCFPGQGWTLTDPDTRQLQVGRHLINYAEMTATLEHHKELVLFWYQAHDKTET